MRWPRSPFQGGRSRPGISRPNLTHFTMCVFSAAGCEADCCCCGLWHLSSAIRSSRIRVQYFEDTANGGEFLGARRTARICGSSVDEKARCSRRDHAPGGVKLKSDSIRDNLLVRAGQADHKAETVVWFDAVAARDWLAAALSYFENRRPFENEGRFSDSHDRIPCGIKKNSCRAIQRQHHAAGIRSGSKIQFERDSSLI